MAYEFRKIYQVAAEAGCEITKNNTIEIAESNIGKVKEWFDKTFPDIFETGDIAKTTVTVTLKIYFKGTNNGIWLCSATNNSNNVGIFTDNNDTSYVGSNNSALLYQNGINLLIIKSKYGFITGFYVNNTGIDKSILSFVINGQNRLIPLIMDKNKTSLYTADGVSATMQSGLMASNRTDEVYLTRYCPPGTDYIPEGIYINQCAGVKSCAVYTVGSGSEKFAELSSADGYISFALKLEEPTEADYEGIKPLRSVE